MFETNARVAPLLLRVALALIIFPHGGQHLLGWFGGYGYAGTHEWMTHTLGIPAAFATLAIVTEFVAPLALLIGFAGRVAALGLAGLMLVAASTHLEHGFFMNWAGSLPAGAEGFEYHLLAVAIAVAIVIEGSGAWSVDRALTTRWATAGRRALLRATKVAGLLLVAALTGFDSPAAAEPGSATQMPPHAASPAGAPVPHASAAGSAVVDYEGRIYAP